MTPDQVELNSSGIIRRLVGLPEYIRCRCIMLYWSCHNEVHTHLMVRTALKEGRKVILPRCDRDDKQIYPHQVRDLSREMEVGPFGILQPNDDAPELPDLGEIDICVVPGIAFDQDGNRVGRGLGYYDRFLRKLPEKTEKIGLAYAFQIVNKIYPTGSDASVDKIVTEKETLVARPPVIK